MVLKTCVVAVVAAMLCGSSAAQGTTATEPAPVAGQVLGSVVRTQDADELTAIVLTQLLDRYAQEQRISATPAEVDAYVRSVQEFLRKDRDRMRVQRDELTARLRDPTLTASQRSALASELASVNGALDALGDLDASNADPEDAKARREIGAASVRRWKINAALYRQYGGRIVFQQAGPEPLDAYRRFLEERQARGDFRITDPALEARFWRYFRDDSIHSFYRAGSREEAEAFRTPPWEATPSN